MWNSFASWYVMPYTVHFLASGEFNWVSPLNKSKWGVLHTVEAGHGQVLSPIIQKYRDDGSWEAHFFGANRYNLCNSTTCVAASTSTKCACYYLGSHGLGLPITLSNYHMAEPFNTSKQTEAEACGPYIQKCPVDNATASKLLGTPFLEVYATCIAQPENTKSLQMFLVVAVSSIVVASLLYAMFRFLPNAQASNDFAYYLSVDGDNKMVDDTKFLEEHMSTSRQSTCTS